MKLYAANKVQQKPIPLRATVLNKKLKIYKIIWSPIPNQSLCQS